MITIGEQIDELISKTFPDLKLDLKIAHMETSVTSFVGKCLFLSLLFSLNFSVVILLLFLLRVGYPLLAIPFFVVLSVVIMLICLKIPKANQEIIRKEIESDIFTPSGILLTMLESGSSIIRALEGVSFTSTKSGKYFGRIASEIYLGKNLNQAIEDAIRYTPSKSFRRVVEPINKSIRTGVDIQQNLQNTLNELSQEKIVEIERYEKKLGPFSMLYLIFGTILPALGIIGFALVMSILGARLEFFPFLFLLLIGILIIQYFFIKIVKNMRPLVKL